MARTSTYPWDVWTDKKRHTIRRGKDYLLPDDSMRKNLYQRGALLHLGVETRIFIPGEIQFQYKEKPLDNLPDSYYDVLEFIEEHSSRCGFPPTFKEMSEEFEVNPWVIQKRVAALRARGYLKKVDNRHRTLAL